MTILILQNSCSTTQAVTNSYCEVSHKISLDPVLAVKIWNSFDIKSPDRFSIERTFRGVKNHNDVYNKLCIEK